MFCKEEQVEKHIIPTMGKTPCCEKNGGLKKGPWTVEEDQKLIDYIQMHGHGRWRLLPKNAGLKRCGKSCRLRWTNYLRPDIKRGRFSIEEEETIMQLHGVLGNKWSAIAARLPGRTDNEIKNYWNTNIRKKLLRMGIDPVTHSPSLELLQLSSFLSSYHDQVLSLPPSSLGSLRPVLNPNLRSLANAIVFSSQCRNPEFISQNLQDNQLCDDTLKIQENHHQSPTIQDIQACATCSASSSPFLNGTQLMQANLDQSFSQAPTNFSYENDLPNYLWTNTGETLPNYVYNDYSTNQSIIDPLFENQQIFQSNNNDIENIHDSGFGSVLSSTPSSSQTHLNSSSITYANGSSTTTEDERDSYCSNMLMFGMPNNLQVDGFL